MSIIISDLSFGYSKNNVLNNISLKVEDGEIVTILGPSGCGKSTLLNIIAGIYRNTSGSIEINGQSINCLPMEKRNIGYVFQNYSLYPNMTVFKNIAFPLENSKVKKNEIAVLVNELAELFHIERLLKCYPRELSGGEQQRVAIVRALIKKPKLLLMDEPLSNLDAKLAMELRDEFVHIHRRLNTTTIFVTHNQRDAMMISDKIAIMNKGSIMQFGRTDDIYFNPSSYFVAGFFSELPINKLCGVLNEGVFSSSEINYQFKNNKSSDNTLLCFRPEAVSTEYVDNALKLKLRLDSFRSIARENLVWAVDDAGNSYRFSLAKGTDFKNEITVYIKEEDIFLFDKNTGEKII